ncbi:hypothetical protein ACHAWF_015966, partial [Thalassiosira exigua]
MPAACARAISNLCRKPKRQAPLSKSVWNDMSTNRPRAHLFIAGEGPLCRFKHLIKTCMMAVILATSPAKAMPPTLVRNTVYIGIGRPLDDSNPATNSFLETNVGAVNDATSCKFRCEMKSITPSSILRGFSFFEGDGTLNTVCRCWTGGSKKIASTDETSRLVGRTYSYLHNIRANKGEIIPSMSRKQNSERNLQNDQSTSSPSVSKNPSSMPSSKPSSQPSTSSKPSPGLTAEP